MMESLAAVISMRIDGHWFLQIGGWMDEASPQRWLVVKGTCQFLLGEVIPQVVRVLIHLVLLLLNELIILP